MAIKARKEKDLSIRKEESTEQRETSIHNSKFYFSVFISFSTFLRFSLLFSRSAHPSSSFRSCSRNSLSSLLFSQRLSFYVLSIRDTLIWLHNLLE